MALREVAPKLVLMMAGFVIGVAFGPVITEDNATIAPSSRPWVALEGYVVAMKGTNQTQPFVPAAGARIQVGPDFAVADDAGAFRLWTSAPAPSALVAVVTYHHQQHIEWIEIPPEAQIVPIEFQVSP